MVPNSHLPDQLELRSCVAKMSLKDFTTKVGIPTHQRTPHPIQKWVFGMLSVLDSGTISKTPPPPNGAMGFNKYLTEDHI